MTLREKGKTWSQRHPPSVIMFGLEFISALSQINLSQLNSICAQIGASFVVGRVGLGPLRCDGCGEEFVVNHEPALVDKRLAEKQASWLERVLADDHQCDKKSSRPNRIAKLSAEGPLVRTFRPRSPYNEVCNLGQHSSPNQSNV